MHDPYAPPGVSLDASDNRRRRPALVWIISLLYGLGTASRLITTPLLFFGVIPQLTQLPQIGFVQFVLTLLIAILALLFVVQLFRLRTSAVQLCAVFLATSACVSAYRLVQLGIPSEIYETYRVIGTTFGLGLLIAVFLYTRRLRAKKVLI